MALLPIFLFFMIFQIFLLKLAKRKVKKILVGFVYTYLGLILFLTGANAGIIRRKIWARCWQASGSPDPGAHCHGHRIFHRQGRASRICIK